MYPGVPLVSVAFSTFYFLATPRSVILTYPSRINIDNILLPLSSKTKFSGLISRWITLLLWRYSSPDKIQAIKNSLKKIRL